MVPWFTPPIMTLDPAGPVTVTEPLAKLALRVAGAALWTAACVVTLCAGPPEVTGVCVCVELGAELCVELAAGDVPAGVVGGNSVLEIESQFS
jgi:hypothetical protein